MIFFYAIIYVRKLSEVKIRGAIIMKTDKQLKQELSDILDKKRIEALATIGSLNNGFGGWYSEPIVNYVKLYAQEAVKEYAERLNKRAVSYSWVCGNGSAVLLEVVNGEEEKFLTELK